MVNLQVIRAFAEALSAESWHVGRGFDLTDKHVAPIIAGYLSLVGAEVGSGSGPIVRMLDAAHGLETTAQTLAEGEARKQLTSAIAELRKEAATAIAREYWAVTPEQVAEAKRQIDAELASWRAKTAASAASANDDTDATASIAQAAT